MLARFLFLSVLLPAVALAADDGAPPPSSKITVPQAQAAPSAPKTPAKATTLAAAAAPAPYDGGECRVGCAQAEYFCQAGDHPESCAGSWSQCVATCDAPNLAAGFSTGQ